MISLGVIEENPSAGPVVRDTVPDPLAFCNPQVDPLSQVFVIYWNWRASTYVLNSPEE